MSSSGIYANNFYELCLALLKYITFRLHFHAISSCRLALFVALLLLQELRSLVLLLQALEHSVLTG